METLNDDFSLCQDDSISVSEDGSLDPCSTVDNAECVAPPTVMGHSTEGEEVVLKMPETLVKLMENLFRENERLSVANERLHLKVINGLEEMLQLALKENAQLKAAETNRTVDTGTIHSGIGNMLVTLKKGQDEMKSYIDNLVSEKHTDIKLSLDKLRNSLAAMKEEILSLQQEAQPKNESSNPKANMTSIIEENPPKSLLFWKKSKSQIATFESKDSECDVLDCEPLIFGNKYKWSIKVISFDGFGVSLGVASTIHKLDFNKNLGGQEGGWSYPCCGTCGTALHANKLIKYNLPKYKSGSKLTFMLDLTGNGTLSVYYDDDDTTIVELFDNMKSDMDVDGLPLAGFVPAAGCYRVNSAKIEFLGFEDI